MRVGSVLMIAPLWGRDGGVAAHVRASAAALAERGLRVAVLAARVDDAESAGAVSVFRSPELFDAAAPIERRLGAACSFTPEVVHLHQFDEPETVAALRRRAPVVASAHAYVGCPSGVHYFRPGRECTRAHGPACVAGVLAQGCAHTRHLRAWPSAYARAGRALQALSGADLAVSYSSAVDRHLAVNGVERRRVLPLFATLPPPARSPLAGHDDAGHDDSGHGDSDGGDGDGGGGADGESATRRRVLYAGRLVKPKGVGTLIRAAREVPGELVICGDGRLAEPLRALARRLGVERRVRFTGWLAPEPMARELASASVVALPSLWPEPFGLVGIEALAAARPVVATRAGGTSEWLRHGVTGLSVPPGDARALAGALNALLSDPQRRRGMGVAGRELVAERFSPDRHVSALLDAYDAARSSWRSRPCA